MYIYIYISTLCRHRYTWHTFACPCCVLAYDYWCTQSPWLDPSNSLEERQTRPIAEEQAIESAEPCDFQWPSACSHIARDMFLTPVATHIDSSQASYVQPNIGLYLLVRAYQCLWQKQYSSRWRCCFQYPDPRFPLFQSWRKDAQHHLTNMKVYFRDRLPSPCARPWIWT